jgi:hypothetical protein
MPLVPPEDWVLKPFLEQQLYARHSKTWIALHFPESLRPFDIFIGILADQLTLCPWKLKGNFKVDSPMLFSSTDMHG